MPSTSAHRNARYLLYHTAAIADGDFSTPSAINLGPLADGTEMPPPESQTDSYQGGEAEAMATLDHSFRVMGLPTLTALQTAKDAAPPTALYFFVTNHGGTAYTQIGPCNVKQAIPLGMSMDPKRASTLIAISAKGDTAEDIYSNVATSVTLP